MLLIDFSGIAHAMTVIAWNNTVEAIQTEYGGNINVLDKPELDPNWNPVTHYIEQNNIEDFDERFALEFRARVLTTLLQVKNLYAKSNEEIVIAVDAKMNWRRQEFPEYKANRKANRDKDNIDWKLAFQVRNDLLDALKEKFFFKVIKYEDLEKGIGCEADDIIAILSRYKEGRESITIISDDSDFYQLHDIDGLTQYNYKKVQKTWEHASRSLKIGDDVRVTPAEFKELKILNGDRKDGVPNFLSDGDVWIDDSKKPVRLGGKTALKILKEEDKMVAKYGDLSDIRKSEYYLRNKKVIDLNEIPDYVEDSVIDQYLTFEYTGSISSILEYLSTYVNVSSDHLLSSAHDFQIRGISKPKRKRRRSIFS